MSEVSERATQGAASASAPGDLPSAAILERTSLKASEFRHDSTLSPRTPTPGQLVAVTASSGAVMGIRRAEIWYTTDGARVVICL